MADIRCPNCGKNNPDFLDACQFCQSPLTPDSPLQIGQSPTKKNTGELEPILPEWLRDVRQQSRESAEEGEIPPAATQPRVQKNEAPDLLAGLVSSQSDDEEEDDIPDWLASINPVAKQKPAEPSKPEPVNDFFAQFNQSKPAPEKPSEPPQEESPAWMGGTASSKPEQPADKDELSEWFSSASKEPNEPFEFQPGGTQDTPAWMNKEPSQPAPEEKEDLSWLHTLEAASKQSETPSQPKQDAGWNFNEPSTPSSSQEDLSWLSDLGGTPAQSASSQPSQGDDLSWLNDLGGTAQPAQPATPQPSQPEDLRWLNALGGTSEPSQPAAAKPSQPEDLSWLDSLGATSQPAQPASQPSQPEDLSWLNALGSTPEPAQPSSSQEEDLGWLNALGGTPAPVQPSAPQPSQPEDLSWLNNLGGTPEAAQPSASQPAASEDLSWLDTLGGTAEPAQPASSQEDMSWLSNLGGTPVPAQPTAEPASTEDLSWLDTLGGTKEPAQPSAAPTSSQDDLGWLREFGGTSEPAQETPAAQEDLSWLNNLGGTAEPAQPAPSTPDSGLDWLGKFEETSTPAQPEPAASSTDELDWLKNFAGTTSEPSQPAGAEPIELGWLDNLGSTSEPSQSVPASSQGDLDWLADLGEPSSMPGYISAKPFGTTEELNPPKELGKDESERVSPFVPRKTAPLGDAFHDDMPDWLKKATEETPNLPLGAGTLEQFRETPRKPAEETPPSAPTPDYVGSNVFSTASTPQSISNQDIDSLFSVDMPDWLSKPQPEGGDIPSQSAGTPVRDETLSPVDLPSWVQAMRPVESVLEESGPSIETHPTEKEGPLAGLRGVIPSAPIGSSRRPKAISLKLQATDEQQAGAALFDQILAAEVTSRVMESAPAVSSQKVMRWTIAGILLVILGAILFMRSQFMPVYPILSADASAATDAISAIPDNSKVLVVVDYEASLAGEMEAVGAPVLYQTALSAQQTQLHLLATSPESAGLIERLLLHAGITKPGEEGGLAYTAGNQYFNLGYLPGGSAGIMGFTSRPQQVIPSITVQNFVEYSAVILLTDNAESGRAWLEQLDIVKQSTPDLANQAVILVTSAQTGPMLQPYVSSGQAAGMVNGLADAARFEWKNAIPETNRLARTYWDAFGIGILMAILLITVGSVWSLINGLRARRASGEQG